MGLDTADQLMGRQQDIREQVRMEGDCRSQEVVRYLFAAS